MRLPGFGKLMKLLRIRDFRQSVRALDRFAKAKIIDRIHIRSVQNEHEEHLGGPSADAADI